MRNRYMGFVFQNSMLLEDFTSLENVAMPLLIRGEKRRSALEKAEYYLELVSMEDRRNYRPNILSGERDRGLPLPGHSHHLQALSLLTSQPETLTRRQVAPLRVFSLMQ